MYIKNVEEVVPALRERLLDYLILQKVIEPGQKKFSCIVHDDHDPSMSINPKNGYQTAHCFSCGATIDIFKAAAILESMPESGSSFVTETVVRLAEQLQIPLQLGDTTPQDKEKLRLYKLAQDITDILEENQDTEYTAIRHWENNLEFCGRISEEDLISQLLDRGWEIHEINTSLMVRTSRQSFFGQDKVTFIIRDYRGHPIGFVSRNLEKEPKYINTSETLIYSKGSVLLGLDRALLSSKKEGLYIVEGPGDRAQFLRNGILNVVALCGTALTKEHASLIKMLGIHNIYLCLDWDAPGVIATARAIEESFKGLTGLNCSVIDAPKDMGTFNDPDKYILELGIEKFLALPKTPAFDWIMHNISDNNSPDTICSKMIPIIAIEPAAVRRELLTRRLHEYTGISFQAIGSDVNMLRNGKFEERRERLLAAAAKYKLSVEKDPENISAVLGQHEKDLEIIEQDYEKDSVGVNYQLSRFDALQDLKKSEEGKSNMNEFKMNKFSFFSEALKNGMTYTSGTLILFGGRANSGKTATMLHMALDVAITDPDTLVVAHFTDDPYVLVEPRLKTNISNLINGNASSPLTVGMAASPYFHIATNYHWDLYNQATAALRELVSSEKLTVIDGTDGPTLTVLERTVKYLRIRYPGKKMLIICDNLHNYADFGYLEQRAKIASIADGMKHIASKYHACVVTTAEYRKNMPMDQSKLKLPVNDDLADARELMYRANAIVHVYNDLRDRGDYAEFFWTKRDDADKPLPRILLLFGKNKITGFDKSLWLDLDPNTVTLRQIDPKITKLEYQAFKNGNVTIQGGKIIVEATDYNEDEELDE